MILKHYQMELKEHKVLKVLKELLVHKVFKEFREL